MKMMTSAQNSYLQSAKHELNHLGAFSMRSMSKRMKRRSKVANAKHSDTRLPDTLQHKLKNEIVFFCQNTTIRGVTRIVNARSKTFKIIWLFCVIGLLSGLFTCMFFLTRQYLEYHVIHPPQVLRDTPSPFPSMTLCNLRPLSSQATDLLSKLKLKTPREFGNDVNNFAAKAYYYAGDTYSYQMITSAISMGGYLESIPEEVVPQLGHNKSETVIHCMVLHTEGSKRVMNECNQIGRWRRFVHAQYLNCYTYDLYEAYRDHVRTIELFVYLDGPTNKTSCPDCFSSEIKSQLSGAVVIVHNADTYPDINQEGINIQPGSLTEIKVKTIKHTQKTPPYGRCSPDTPATIKLYGSQQYAYSEHACRMSTIQAEINAHCGCNAIEFPYLNKSLPFCLAMESFVLDGACDPSRPHNITNPSVDDNKSSRLDEIPFSRCLEEMEAVKKHAICKTEVTKQFRSDVVPSCTLPCTFFSYETDRSTSTWPTKSWQLSWLGSRAGRKVLDRPDLAGYRRARELLLQPGGQMEAQQILSRSDVLEQNLLAILLIRPNFNLHNVEEKAVLSLTSLLSQSGGLFSVWIGINMVSFIEVLELFVHLFAKCLFSVRRKTLKRTLRRSTSYNKADTQNEQDPPNTSTVLSLERPQFCICNGPSHVFQRPQRSPSAPEADLRLH